MSLNKLIINGQQINLVPIPQNKLGKISFRINFDKEAVELNIPDFEILSPPATEIDKEIKLNLNKPRKPINNGKLHTLHSGNNQYCIDFITPKSNVNEIAEDMASRLLNSIDFVVDFTFVTFG